MWERKQRIGGERESRHRPRIAIKSIDSKRALKGFRAPYEIDPIDQIPGGGETEPNRSSAGAATFWISAP